MAQSDNLSNSQKVEYANKALKWLWDALKQKPVNSFEDFKQQIFYDEVMQQSYIDEDLPDYGKLVAMYLLDNKNADPDKLQAELEKLAQRTPTGKIPTRYAIGQAVADASNDWSLMSIISNVAKETTEDFKSVVKIASVAVIGYGTYKLIALGISALTILLLLRKKS